METDVQGGPTGPTTERRDGVDKVEESKVGWGGSKNGDLFSGTTSPVPMNQTSQSYSQLEVVPRPRGTYEEPTDDEVSEIIRGKNRSDVVRFTSMTSVWV